MACFLVPTAEAVVATVVQKAVKKKEDSKGTAKEYRFSEKLKWLNGMLWGGSGMLAFEHLWHGEISPFFPFLTAMENPADTVEMLHEMATSGTAMAVLVTAVWTGMVLLSGRVQKVPESEQERAGERT